MTVRRPLAAVLAISLVSFGVLRCNFRQRPRNVVLVCIDTVRYDTWWLAERNGWRDPMREWEGLAIRFDRMQSAAPWTIPSVATVLTGMYPLRHGAGRFRSTVADVDRMRPTVLRPEIDTLPEKLASAGWSTSAIMAPSWVNESTGLMQGVAEIRTVPESEVTAHAIEWLRKDHAKPFFLYLHYMEAHGDQTPEVKQKMAASFSPAERQAVLRGMPANLCGDPANLPCVHYLAYARSVLDLRHQLAKLMDGIRAAGRLDDTLVVIFSDHGEEFGEHLEEEKALANHPRRQYGYGHGRSLYQELLHVPVLIWHPHAGCRTIASPVSLADIEPSIVEWTGVKTPSIAPDGVSFADIRSVDRNFDPERPLFFSGIGYGPEQTGVLWSQLKHISVSCPKEEISFRLENDPLEKKPIAATRLDQKIAGLLDAYRALAVSADMREASLSEEQVASLQAIGYLRGGASAAAEPDVSCSPAAAHDSIGAFDPKSRTLYLRHKNTPGVADTVLKAPGDGVPVFGDWTGAGISTLALFDPARSQFAIYPTNLAMAPEKTIELRLPRHDSHDVPLAGDWNGDRVQTIGVYRPSTSTFCLRNHNTSGPPDLVIRFGEPGDKPVVGDWDGAGKTEIGVYRSSAATFLLRKGLGADQGFTPIVFGMQGDLPLAGDWNGDGTDTIGLYRPAVATFFLRNQNETGQADVAVAFGTPQFLPLAGNWGR